LIESFHWNNTGANCNANEIAAQSIAPEVGEKVAVVEASTTEAARLVKVAAMQAPKPVSATVTKTLKHKKVKGQITGKFFSIN
jgi:hypothetical protein